MIIPFYLINIIMKILYNRTITLTDDATNRIRHQYQGFPQDSVLNPILYNIYAYDIETAITSNMNVLQYTDNFLLYSIDKSVLITCDHLSTSISTLQTWLNNNRFDISVSKSSSLDFSRKISSYKYYLQN